MLIAIDIGNTSTVVGLYDDLKMVGNWRMETMKDAAADELADEFRNFLRGAGFGLDQVHGAAISNVVPPLENAVVEMSRRYFDVEPLLVDAKNAGIKIKYPNPSEIGADRLVNAVAAYEKCRSAVVVVDFGTATTFDYIDSEGAYCGGVIAPGISIANEALYRNASKLPRVKITKTENIIGKSTVEAMQSGIYHGYTGLVSHLIDKIKEDVKTAPQVIATGGLASLIVRDLGIEVDEFLTLDGLRLIYSRIHR